MSSTLLKHLQYNMKGYASSSFINLDKMLEQEIHTYRYIYESISIQDQSLIDWLIDWYVIIF